MGISAGQIEAILSLNAEPFVGGLASARQQLSTFLDGTQTAGTRITALGGAMTSTGTTLTKGVTMPLLGISTAAVKVSTDFEAQMSRVKAISGATGEDFTKLREQAKQLGATTSFSAKAAAEGMENLASAGFDTNQIMAAMPGLLDLAASDSLDLGTAADIAASTLNGFGLEASQAAHVADVLAKAAADTNAGITDTGEAMKYIAPVAATMGQSLEEVTAAIGLMSNAGIKGGQAGTTLRTALTRLANPSEKAAELMEDLGFSAYDSQGKMLSLKDIIGKLQVSMQGLTEEQQQQAIATIFGQESMSGMLALISAGPEELEALTESLENCDGAATEMAETMMDNTKGSIDEFTSALEGAGIAVGETLLPMVTRGLNKITEMTTAFNELDPATQNSIVSFGLVAAAIGPLLIGAGKVVSAIGSISTAMQGMGGMLAAASGPVGWIALAVVAVGTLTAAFLHLQNKLDENGTKLDKAADKFDDFTGRVRTNRSLWTQIFGEKIEIEFSDNFEEVRGGIQEEIDGLLQDIQNYYNTKNDMEEADREAALQGITARQLEQRRTLEEHLQANLNSLSEYFMEEQGLTSQQTAEQQQQYTEFYQAQEERFAENQNAINEIYKTAAEEKRELTALEQAKIQEMSEENAGIMTALTTNNIDDMLSAWKAYYESETKLLQASEEQQELYSSNVQGAYGQLTSSIHKNYEEQEKAVRKNTSLNKEQQDQIIENLHLRENAETTFTTIFGNMIQEQIGLGNNFAQSHRNAFSKICDDLETGEISAEDFGMTNAQYMAMALDSMVSAGAGADELTAAIAAIPEDKRPEVIAEIKGTSNAEYLKTVIDKINSKKVTVTYETNYIQKYNSQGPGATKYATGTPNAISGVAEVAENGPELIQSRTGELALATARQFVDLSGGERVYNARQTNEILKSVEGKGNDNSRGFILLAEKIENLTKVTDSLKSNLDNIATRIEEKEFNGDIILDTEKLGEAVYPTISNGLARERSFAR